MGAKAPCWFGRGDVALHKEQRSVGQRGSDHTSNFTQVWAAVRHKTLLLLWWIDGGRKVVVRSTLARQGRQWLRVRGYVARPFLSTGRTPSTVPLDLLL